MARDSGLARQVIEAAIGALGQQGPVRVALHTRTEREMSASRRSFTVLYASGDTPAEMEADVFRPGRAA